MASIEELKSTIGAGNGLAVPNRYLVQMPAIPGSTLTSAQRNTLCRTTRLPGRQILTHDRQIGLMQQKVGYGYANAEIGLSFHVLNDYKTKEYFDLWQNRIVNQANQQIAYADDYKYSVKIYQLKKSERDLEILNRDFSLFGIDFNLDISLSSVTDAVYGVELEKAFPVTMNGIDLADASTDATVEISIDLSYQNWKRIK